MRPTERKHRDLLTSVIEPLSQAFKGYGVTLLVFEIDKPGRVNYITNTERSTMLAALNAFVSRTEHSPYKASRSDK